MPSLGATIGPNTLNKISISFAFRRLIVMERCKKSSGLHWDIVLLCILNVPATIFGGPWMCVAQVRAMTHLSALTVMSTNHAPGESSKIIDVKGTTLFGTISGICI